MFKLERVFGHTYSIRFDKQNNKGETMLVELTKCTNPGGKNALPYLWKKNGFIDRVVDSWWSVSTYVYDKDGNCWMRYNPTIKVYKEIHKEKTIACRHIIDFDYIVDATEENAIKLLKECEDWFLNCRKNKIVEIVR